MNYVNSEGTQGYFQLHTFVYGKTGQPCKVCGAPIRKTVVASRSTHFCAEVPAALKCRTTAAGS